MTKSEHLAVERIRLRQDAMESQVAVVAGDARGIGRGIVETFVKLGARVVIAGASDQGPETEHGVRAGSDTTLFVRTDVSDEAAVAQLAQRAEEAFGPVDILVNTAARCPLSPVIETEVGLWDRVIAHNLRSAFLTCRAFLPGMVQRKRGTVVNFVSTDPLPYLAACSSAAQGTVGLTKALAAEVENHGVRVVAFAPGMVDTVETREIAQGLGMRFGFAAEDLLNDSPHPAYDGPMPVDHAAAAIAYLVAVLADEYHGQKVTSYTVLERAGFIEPMDQLRRNGARAADPAPSDGQAATVPIEVALSRRLQQVIDDTDEEFGRLVTYVRPIVRRSFEAKTGQTIAEWRDTAANLTTLLEKVRACDGMAEAILRASYPCLKDWLAKLISYYHEAPVEMASITRDAGVLRDVAFYSPQRETSLLFLVGTLERLATRAYEPPAISPAQRG